MAQNALGRRPPKADWSHVQTHPLTAANIDALPKPTPVGIGVNWYSNFDSPVRDSTGHYWIGRDDLGHVRGGHCVCLKPKGVADPLIWWKAMNQGSEGACVGFGMTRMMMLLNRKRYDPWWLWDMAKLGDEWPDTKPGDSNGTSVHAAADVLRLQGHVPWRSEYQDRTWQTRDLEIPVASEGITTVRWATTADDVLATLGYTGLDYVDILNSWGQEYPHMVRLPATVLARLLTEDGEMAVVTDR